jgi:hypothetical protein
MVLGCKFVSGYRKAETQLRIHQLISLVLVIESLKEKSFNIDEIPLILVGPDPGRQG